MKPPSRKTRAIPQPKPVPVVKEKPPTKVKNPAADKEKDLKWKPKEKQDLLDGIKTLSRPKLPDDLMKLQRHVPTRSVAEIETFINDLLKQPLEKLKSTEKDYADSNVKKWIDLCDKCIGRHDVPICSSKGTGEHTCAHPAQALSTLVECGDESSECDFSKISGFIQNLLQGENPYQHWGPGLSLESAVLLELIQDVLSEVQNSIFDKQHEFFFEKYRGIQEAQPEQALTENPMPNSLWESTLLNPLEMQEGMAQAVIKKTLPIDLYAQNSRSYRS